jgi:hypothetical protein
MEAGLYSDPVGDILSGNVSIADIAGRVGGAVLRKAVNMAERGMRSRLGRYGGAAFDYVSGRMDYAVIRNYVANVLEGRPTGRVIHEVGYGELPDGNIGMFEGRDVYVPKVSEIPDVYGEKYRDALKMSGLGESYFNKAQRDYVLTHELVESWAAEKYGETDYRDRKVKLSPERHAEMEALMHRALAEFGAMDIYRAGRIMHASRDGSDQFKRLTGRYMAELRGAMRLPEVET